MSDQGPNPPDSNNPAPPPPPPPPPAGGTPPPPPPPGAVPAYGGTPAGFSIGNAFNYGWLKFQQNVGPILLAMLVVLGVLAVIGIIFYALMAALAFGSAATCTTVPGTVYNNYQPTLDCSGGAGLGFFGTLVIGGVGVAVMVIVSYLLQAGVVRMALALTRGEPISVGMLFITDRLGKVIAAGIMVGIATGIGYMLCYIPGIIIAFFCQFFIFYIIDKDLAPVDAIKASFSFVNRNLGTLVLLYLASALALFIGALVCYVGLFIAFPVVIIAQTYAYKKLNGQEVAA